MKFGIALLCLLLVYNGCFQGLGTEEKSVNFVRICSEKEDLKGYTQRQIRNMLGEPDSIETTYIYNNLKQVWSYINMQGKVKITFINGVAMEADYD